MIEDVMNQQCAFLGRHCQDYRLVQSTVDSAKMIPTCVQFGSLPGHVMTSKHTAISYLMREEFYDPYSFKTDLEGFKLLAEKFATPVSDFDARTDPYYPETSPQVLTQCQSDYCMLCQKYNLTKCLTCWGRFGQEENAQICKPQATCEGAAISEGCYQTAEDCLTCNICKLGFARLDEGSCSDCRANLDPHCADCDQTSCLKCERGFGLD